MERRLMFGIYSVWRGGNGFGNSEFRILKKNRDTFVLYVVCDLFSIIKQLVGESVLIGLSSVEKKSASKAGLIKANYNGKNSYNLKYLGRQRGIYF